MPVLIKNRKAKYRMLPYPVNDTLLPNHQKRYPYVEYDKLINNQTFVDLQNAGEIQIISLESGGVPVYDSAWNGPVRFRLGTYQFWVDATGALRMKNGDATFDLDGTAVGGIHGASHVFNGSDPIPNIETLEDQWTTLPGAVSAGDLVYATGANTCDRANASGIATMPVIGVVQTVLNPTTVIVARAGDVGGFVGLTPDAPYFAGLLPGQMALTAPVGSGQVVQKIGYAKNATTIVIALGEHTIRA